MARYDAAGVDQLIFVLQAGRNRHEHICESLELFAAQVMPPYLEGREEREAAKRAELEGAIAAALDRRAPAREPDGRYVIDEPAELAKARRARRAAPRELASLAAEQARDGARQTAIRALAALVRNASDEQLERRFGSGFVQRGLFAGMARAFEPDAAGGFQGELVYELSRPATAQDPVSWTVSVTDGRASARPGGAAHPQLTLRFQLADFVRVAAGLTDPALPLLEGRATFEGDFGLVAKLPEMFGAQSPY